MTISQREARKLRRRVEELERERDEQRRKWVTEWPGGVFLGELQRPREDWLTGRIEGARLLGHAVVITEQNDGKLNFYALPLPRT